MAVTGRIGVGIDLRDARQSDSESVIAQISKAFGWDVAAGVAAGQANLIWQDTSTILTAGVWSLDVAGTMTNQLGAAVFTVVKGIAIIAADANTTDVTVSRPAANGLPFLAAGSDALAPMGAGDGFAFWRKGAGITVTAGTGDLIYVTNAAGASADVTAILVGLS